MAQLLNRLAANQQPQEPSWAFAHCRRGRDWISLQQQQGWQVQARLRCSVASFGLGASLQDDSGQWQQVPLALPLRTGLLLPAPPDQPRPPEPTEALALLPHSALELELRRGDLLLLLQYYQGTEGLCGWAGLNDLRRPWQNDRHNGSVRYLGEPYGGERLLELIDLTEVMALVHNQAASRLGLRSGGYGSLGFCIDTTALLQQAMEGRCQLFPLLLSGLWRERLLAEAQTLSAAAGLSPQSAIALERYRQAVQTLPLDLSHQGVSSREAWCRLQACQPSSSPFRLVDQCRAVSTAWINAAR